MEDFSKLIKLYIINPGEQVEIFCGNKASHDESFKGDPRIGVRERSPSQRTWELVINFRKKQWKLLC